MHIHRCLFRLVRISAYEQADAKYGLAQNGMDEGMSSTKLTHNDKGYESFCSHSRSNPVENPHLQEATNEQLERSNHMFPLAGARYSEQVPTAWGMWQECLRSEGLG